MIRPRAYVESTIPSLHCDTRMTPEIIARREWTRRWWQVAVARYELVTSEAVLDELAGGKPESAAERLRLVKTLPLLAIDSAIVEIVRAYVRHRVMPADPAGGCAPSGVGLLPQV